MPAMTARPYPAGIRASLGGGVTGGRDFDSDALKITLHGTGYTPNYDTDAFQSILTSELSTAGGYTSGGLTLSGVTFAATAANSWGVVAATSTAYVAGQIVRPSAGNGFIYVAAVGGTSGGSAPTWPTTLYTTVADGSVTWCCIGRGAVALDFNDPSWATFTAGPFRYAVVADTTPGTAATNPLLCAFDFGSGQTGGGGTFSIAVDPAGALVLPY
jgi:hypothetical protein